ncbi:MAG TPA: DUF3822 family protein [Sunxiuqinia sp.]|nr:DUF3822 family protein [Sunxiuqinia sp.]
MQHLLLVDETFDLNFTQEYYLSIQINLDGFSFCIRDRLQNKYIYLFHKEVAGKPEFLVKKLSDMYAENEVLTADFKATSILCAYPDKTTLIPDGYFSDDHASENYELNRELKNGEIMHHQPVHSYNSVLQVAIPGRLKEFLQEKHPGIFIQNEFLSFLEHDHPKPTNDPLMLVQLYKSQVTICVVDDTIRFFNSFYYQNENDLLFYLLNVTKATEVEDFKLILNGVVNKRSAVYHRLRQYFKDVSIVERSSDVYYSYLFDQLPDARFVNLLNHGL